MNIRDLKYLIALSDYKHFGKAAESCFVSQPALSMQIKKLEKDLGVTLLERTNKSVVLTSIGDEIAARAKDILQRVDELRSVAKLAQDPYGGELKLGIIPTLAPYLLPLIVPSLKKAFPRISFYLVEEQTAVLNKKLVDGVIDAAFLATPAEDKKLVSELLFEEEFLLAVPRKHELAKHKIIRQNDLVDKEILLLDEGHCMRNQIQSLCYKVKAIEAMQFRATSLETLRHMVAIGNGITLIPTLAKKSNDGICYIPFSAPKPKRLIELTWRKSSIKHDLLTDVADNVKVICK